MIILNGSAKLSNFRKSIEFQLYQREINVQHKSQKKMLTHTPQYTSRNLCVNKKGKTSYSNKTNC